MKKWDNNFWWLFDQHRQYRQSKSPKSFLVHDNEGLSQIFFGKCNENDEDVCFVNYMHGMLFSDFKAKAKYTITHNLIKKKSTIDTLTQLTSDRDIQFGDIIDVVGSKHDGELTLGYHDTPLDKSEPSQLRLIKNWFETGHGLPMEFCDAPLDYYGDCGLRFRIIDPLRLQLFDAINNPLSDQSIIDKLNDGIKKLLKYKEIFENEKQDNDNMYKKSEQDKSGIIINDDITNCNNCNGSDNYRHGDNNKSKVCSALNEEELQMVGYERERYSQLVKKIDFVNKRFPDDYYFIDFCHGAIVWVSKEFIAKQELKRDEFNQTTIEAMVNYLVNIKTIEKDRSEIVINMMVDMAHGIVSMLPVEEGTNDKNITCGDESKATNSNSNGEKNRKIVNHSNVTSRKPVPIDMDKLSQVHKQKIATLYRLIKYDTNWDVYNDDKQTSSTFDADDEIIQKMVWDMGILQWQKRYDQAIQRRRKRIYKFIQTHCKIEKETIPNDIFTVIVLHCC